MTVDKPCRDCGTMMLAVSHRKQICPRCVAKHKNAHRKNKGTLSEHVPAISLNEMANRATAAGMTYGKYISSLQYQTDLRSKSKK